MSDGEPGLYSEMDVESPEHPPGEHPSSPPGGEPGGPPGGEPGSPTGTPGAPDDEEMPLQEHIQEMVHRLGIVVLAMSVVSALAFPFADRLINFLWFSLLPGLAQQCPPPTGAETGATCPRVYHPLALMLARIKIAALAGFIIALPVFVLETYLFMKPGLFPRERRYYKAAVPTSLVLAGIGVAFAFFLVLPAIFTYFLYYSEGAAEIAFGLSETFNLMVMMLGLFAFIFQIPLFIMLAIMMGVTTRRWLETRRLYFWGGFLTLAFLFSPDPTGMAPIIVALTMVTLFEGTLLMLRWTGTGTMVPTPREVAGARPYVWVFAGLVGYVVSSLPAPTGYYGQFPPVVVDTLTQLGLVPATPALIGGAIIALYEGVGYLLRRGRYRRPYRQLARFRIPVWLVAIVVGYLGSPSPELLVAVDSVALADTVVLAIVAGVIACYEASLALWRFQRSRR